MLKEILDKTEWEGFLEESGESVLLQSWNWGEFAEAQGREVFRVGEREGGNLQMVAQLTKVTSKRGNYLEAHQGPVGKIFNFQLSILSEKIPGFLGKLKRLAKDEEVDFLRVRLPYRYDQELVNQLAKFGFVKAPMYFPAEHTLLLDLTPSEEDLLANMRKNTRYSVRRAEREDVNTQMFSRVLNPKGLEHALGKTFRLYQKTVDRQGFVPYDFEYFKNELEAFAADNKTEIFLAVWEGETVAAAVVLYHGDYAYYHHAASIRTDPDVYAPYAVLWEVIKSAKDRGKKFLDFWGVAPPINLPEEEYEYDKDHPRAGLTLFKKGFGGKYVRYMPTMDLPVSPKYWLTYAFVRYERWRRGL